MTFFAMSGVREIDLMTASLPRSMRRAISTSPSRVSSGTVPISRRYMRTGSLVLSSAPGVRSSSSSSAPSAVRSIGFVVAKIFLIRVDDLDAGAAEGVEQIVELVRRGDFGRQRLVDLVVEQVALLLADVNQLPYFVVFFFDRHRLSSRCRPRSLPSRSAPSDHAWLLFRSDAEVDFRLPERVDLVSVLTGAELLQPVDFALDGGPFALPPQPLQRPDALGGRGRGRRRGRRCW